MKISQRIGNQRVWTRSVSVKCVNSADDRDIILDEWNRKLVEVSVEHRSVVVVINQSDGDDGFELPGSVVSSNPQRILIPSFSIETLGHRNLSRDRMNDESTVRIVDELVGDVRVFRAVFVDGVDVQKVGSDCDVFRDIESVKSRESRRVVVHIFDGQ